MKIRMIVHGGAWDIPDAYDRDHLQGTTAALQAGVKRLQNGNSAIDAVETAVRLMEEDATFDAGCGAHLNAAGDIELDASIMNGADLEFGAVAAVKNILHPVTLARRIMTDSEHGFLVGRGAEKFAAHLGMPQVTTESLLTERELAFFNKTKVNHAFRSHHPIMPRGTVGAVALDNAGNLAAATSTGGTPRKLPGRVGDSPLIGAGTYADNSSGATSATGWGEAIMKVLLSFRVCEDLRHIGADEAARKGIELLHRKTKGYAGIIGIGRNGDYLARHNTPKMAFAYYDNSGNLKSSLKRGEKSRIN